MNKKRRHLAIKGILIDGEWIDNPTRIKSKFYNHFANRFSAPNWTRVLFDDQFPSRLNIDHSCYLERDVTIEEIKKAVWDCGFDKSHGLDGFTFEFFKKYWSIVGNDVVNAVKEFFLSSTFPNGCNPSFVALIPKVLDAKHLNDFRPISLVGCQYKIIGKILANRLSLVIDDIISQEQSAFMKGRQIMDGPIILNEVIAWCKSKKEQSLLFKVDFQKVFDSVRWDHLDDILGKFAFGNKWCGWIQGCLLSSKAPVLVNGSPTGEFTFHRGLRQGDPLYPFLFILVMESLHVSFQRLIDRGMFTPISVGNDNLVPISHLFYADDAMFIGKWTCENVNVLMMMLHCFFLASSLKINVQKSSIFGVGVRSSDVHSMVVRYGCLASTLPFTYLGVKVGANMKRVNSWGEVVKKVTSKLSTWKAKTLSVGGRLTLIKSVLGVIPTYYMSLFKAPEGVLKHLERIRNSFFLGADLDERKITWVSWRKVMAQKQHAGLGVNSLYALNLALIFKWIWRFKSAHSGLWLNVIKAIYGNEGSLDHLSLSYHGCSVWSGILKAIDKLKTKGFDLHNFFKLVVGNGNTIKFWHDKWYGDVCFKEKFHMCFNLEIQKDISIALKLQSNNFALSFRRRPRSGIEESQFGELSSLLALVVLSNAEDRWSWSLSGHGEFLVKSAREVIDKHVLITSSTPTRWSKVLPIKLNIFMWRMLLDKLPTRSNLTIRGLDVPCSLCLNRETGVETRDHLFFVCPMALDLFRLLGRWWNIQIPILLDPSTWESWLNSLRLNSLQKLVLEASFSSLWWHIWVFRNATLFSSKKPLKGMIFNNFVSQTFTWVLNRCRKFNCNWVDWLKYPLNAISM
ncbi:RNA-directed DNA polymerase, eukaryota [Tanacetum coccineum]